tara:strand:+ start:341 stop:1366 length:1026 start_codon:yes stop_codon:yes gene_type:complete
MKTQEPVQIQWIKHVSAENNERGSDPKDIIENVTLSAADGIRGDLTGKEYKMPDALAMTEKYDRLADAGYFRKDPHLNSLSATDAVIAAKTGKDAAAYHKQKPSLIKNWNELRAKRNKILNDIKKEKLRGDKLKIAWGLTKKDPDLKSKMRGWIQQADDEKLVNSKILKNNINNKKRNTFDEYVKTGKLPTLTKEEIKELEGNKRVRDYIINKDKPKKVAYGVKPNGFDPNPNVIPIGPIPHEKPWWETNYQFKFPKKEKYTVLDKIKLQADLEKAADAASGIGQFDKRIRLASGSNGSTSKWEEDHPFTKRVQDIYGIQLTGQETFGELLEIIRKINEQE